MLTQEITKEVLGMGVIDRVHLAELIFDSLDKPDIEVERKWILESEKRYQAYKAGRTSGINLSDIRQRYDK